VSQSEGSSASIVQQSEGGSASIVSQSMACVGPENQAASEFMEYKIMKGKAVPIRRPTNCNPSDGAAYRNAALIEPVSTMATSNASSSRNAASSVAASSMAASRNVASGSGASSVAASGSGASGSAASSSAASGSAASDGAASSDELLNEPFHRWKAEPLEIAIGAQVALIESRFTGLQVPDSDREDPSFSDLEYDGSNSADKPGGVWGSNHNSHAERRKATLGKLSDGNPHSVRLLRLMKEIPRTIKKFLRVAVEYAKHQDPLLKKMEAFLKELDGDDSSSGENLHEAYLSGNWKDVYRLLIWLCKDVRNLSRYLEMLDEVDNPSRLNLSPDDLVLIYSAIRNFFEEVSCALGNYTCLDGTPYSFLSGPCKDIFKYLAIAALFLEKHPEPRPQIMCGNPNRINVDAGADAGADEESKIYKGLGVFIENFMSSNVMHIEDLVYCLHEILSNAGVNNRVLSGLIDASRLVELLNTKIKIVFCNMDVYKSSECWDNDECDKYGCPFMHSREEIFNGVIDDCLSNNDLETKYLWIFFRYLLGSIRSSPKLTFPEKTNIIKGISKAVRPDTDAEKVFNSLSEEYERAYKWQDSD